MNGQVRCCGCMGSVVNNMVRIAHSKIVQIKAGVKQISFEKQLVKKHNLCFIIGTEMIICRRMETNGFMSNQIIL